MSLYEGLTPYSIGRKYNEDNSKMTKETALPRFVKKVPIQRDSSIELYRIIATFAVLITHFNGFFVGGTRAFDIHHITDFSVCQMILEAASCICVNMFVIISGYFGIRLRLISIVNLLVKLLLIFVPFYLAWALYTSNFNPVSLLFQFLVVSRAGWFIQSYIMLMFLSPCLNSFVEKYGRNILLWCVTFVLIEFWFDSIMTETLGVGISFHINRGYSFIHFVLMYMLARCIFLYRDELLKVKRWKWTLGYICCTFFLCFLFMMGCKFSWSYSNPIVVVSSICTFIPFLYKSYYNYTINWIAKSTLAVYIIHSDTKLVHLLMKIDNDLLAQYDYFVYLPLCLGVILAVFFFCIIYDKVCELFIKPVMVIISPKMKGVFEFR